MRAGPHPERWVTGPDPLKHSMYKPFLVSRAQAKFRNEPWELEFEDFYEIWKDKWDTRGRSSTSNVLRRKNISDSWNKDNIHLVERKNNRTQEG